MGAPCLPAPRRLPPGRPPRSRAVTNPIIARVSTGAAAVAIAAGLVLTVSAQGQAPAGQNYRAPRTADGRPDLQGIWQAMNTAVWNIQDHPAQSGVPAGQGVVEGN